MKAARTIALCALLLLAVAGADARKARKAFAPAPAPATAEEPLLEGEAILRAVQEAGFELTPEEIALLELETVAAAPAPAADAEAGMMRRLLEEEVAAAPAPATEEPMLEGEAIMRAVQEAGFELTPEEIALLELETVAAAPAPAEAEAGMMRRLLEEEVAAAPAPATEEPMLEGEAIMRAVQEAGFELTPEEIALLELETVAAAPAPAEAEAGMMRRLLEEAAAPAPATEEPMLEGEAIMRAVQEAGFELTPEEIALLELETAAPAPAPATAEAEAGMMRRLLEEEVAAAPAPATEEPMLEGEAIMRAVQEAGFELTPEEIALLELETVAAAPAPAEA